MVTTQKQQQAYRIRNGFADAMLISIDTLGLAIATDSASPLVKELGIEVVRAIEERVHNGRESTSRVLDEERGRDTRAP